MDNIYQSKNSLSFHFFFDFSVLIKKGLVFWRLPYLNLCCAQSKYVEAIGILEELLKVKKVHFGTTSREFTRTCKQLCEICNILAVYYLKKEDINSALDLLKKSEELCENNELGQAMTFNNMACYYRRIGKMRTALNFLQRALTIESRLQRPEI